MPEFGDVPEWIVNHWRTLTMVAGVVVVVALTGFVVAARLRRRSQGPSEPSPFEPSDDGEYESAEPERVSPVDPPPPPERPVREDALPVTESPREEVSPTPTVEPAPDDAGVRIRQPAAPSTGLTYVDARSMVLDVFNANYLKMSREATAIARTRAETFTNAFLERLEETNPRALDSARDPDMQRAIFTAQLEFASSGDADLGELLVALLVDRAGEPNRSLMQIVLNEALSVSSKLTPDQFDALSLIFLVRYTRQMNLQSPEHLRTYIDNFWVPFARTASRGRPSFQHLQYTGCGSPSGSADEIEISLATRYPWLFCRGFDWSQAAEIVGGEGPLRTVLTRSFHDPERWQLQPVMKDAFHRLAASVGIATGDALWELQINHLLDRRQARGFLERLHPVTADVLSFWRDTPAKQTTLTSVGVAIAHANIRRKTGQEFDLSYWIN